MNFSEWLNANPQTTRQQQHAKALEIQVALLATNTTGWTDEQHRRHADGLARIEHLIMILRPKSVIGLPPPVDHARPVATGIRDNFR